MSVRCCFLDTSRMFKLTPVLSHTVGRLGDYEEAQSWGEMALDIARFCKGRAAEAELQQLTDEFS